MTINNLICHFFIGSINISVLGYVGGSDYKNPGAAVEPLCLPKNPQWGKFKDGKDGQKAELLGAEYQMHTVSNYWRHYHDHDVPCAVCLVRQRSVVQMFPGENIISSQYFFTQTLS